MLVMSKFYKCHIVSLGSSLGRQIVHGTKTRPAQANKDDTERNGPIYIELPLRFFYFLWHTIGQYQQNAIAQCRRLLQNGMDFSLFDS